MKQRTKEAPSRPPPPGPAGQFAPRISVSLEYSSTEIHKGGSSNVDDAAPVRTNRSAGCFMLGYLKFVSQSNLDNLGCKRLILFIVGALIAPVRAGDTEAALHISLVLKIAACLVRVNFSTPSAGARAAAAPAVALRLALGGMCPEPASHSRVVT